MIKVLLRGGLGNQMFQYAHGLQLQAKYGGPLVLDTVYLDDRFPRKDFTYRTFALDVFDLRASFTRLSLLAKKVPLPGFWLGADFLGAKIEQLAGRGELVTEERGPSGKRRNLILFGHWQSDRHFAGVEERLRQEFKLGSPLSAGNSNIAQRIEAANSVSVHVRRGDYLTEKMKAVVGETDPDYYGRAIEYIRARVSDPRLFFVFSDDVAWCRRNLKIASGEAVFLDPNDSGRQGAEHMILMSQAKHHIIANSSFSWWGAWLDPRLDKIVVAPKQWFADGRQNDVVPSNWEQI